MWINAKLELLCEGNSGAVGVCQARLAQSVERQALNLVVGGSSPPVGDSFRLILLEREMNESRFS